MTGMFCLFIAGVALVPGADARADTDNMDYQIAEARKFILDQWDHLDPNDRDRRLDSLVHCHPGTFDPSKYPESPKLAEKALGPKTKALAVYGVLHHGGGQTDREANEGIKNWMRDSVVADCRFYRAAKLFLKELYKRDIEAGTEKDPLVPIQKKATFDVMTLAQSAVRAAYDGTRDDPYLAQKVLALYGHDNLNNQLTPGNYVGDLWKTDEEKNRCEFAVLDAYKPNATSTLYRNGAIPGVDYAAEDVTAGEKIAQECKAACGTVAERVDSRLCLRLCNDSLPDYQADYYHVVAASYLACYAKANANSASLLSIGAGIGLYGARAAADAAFDSEYPSVAKKYKKERFAEEVAYGKLGKNQKPPRWFVVLHEAQELLPGAVDVRGICSLDHMKCDDSDVRAAEAILARQRFEILFREKQHRLGQKLGEKNCAKASFEHPMCAK